MFKVHNNYCFPLSASRHCMNAKTCHEVTSPCIVTGFPTSCSNISQSSWTIELEQSNSSPLVRKMHFPCSVSFLWLYGNDVFQQWSTISSEINWVQILASAHFEQKLIRRLQSEFSYENLEDSNGRSNPDFICFFVRCETKSSPGFKGNKKTQETYSGFGLLPV